MAIQKINLGTEPHGVGGDSYRTANEKINSNFEEVGKNIEDVLDVVMTGDFSKTAYDIAVKNGFVGSEQEWLASLKGEQGPEAKSVYDIAVSHGFVGDEQDWLNYILENSETVSDLFADADSLEQFINGSEDETVLTRLSAEYPTLQKAIKELFENGGIAGRFNTLTELQASPLLDGSYALVADDTIDKNGIYIKEAGSWVKSKYDLKSLIDSLVEKDSGDDAIVKILDSKGYTVYQLTKTGEHYLVGFDADLKSYIDDKSKKISALSINPDDDSILTVLDSAGKKALVLSKDGGLYTVKGDITRQLDKLQEDIKSISTSRDKIDVRTAGIGAMFADNVLMQDMPNYEKTEYLLWSGQADASKEFPNKIWFVRIPSVLRVSKSNYILFFEARYSGGDFDANSSGYMPFSISTDGDAPTVSMGEVKSLHNVEVDSQGKQWSFMNPAAVKISDNNIVAMYVRRYQDKEHMLYLKRSTDGGKTWSQHEDISHIYADEGFNLVCPMTGGLVKKRGLHKGRVIMPCWHSGKTYVTSEFRFGFLYSDDDGVTWHLGDFADVKKANELAVVEDINGDLVFTVRIENNPDNPKMLLRYAVDTGKYTPIHTDTILSKGSVHSGLTYCMDEYSLSNPKLIVTSAKEANRTGLLVHTSYNDGEDWHTHEYANLASERVAYSLIVNIDETYKLIVWEADNTANFKCSIVTLKHLLDK